MGVDAGAIFCNRILKLTRHLDLCRGGARRACRAARRARCATARKRQRAKDEKCPHHGSPKIKAYHFRRQHPILIIWPPVRRCVRMNSAINAASANQV